VKRAIVGWFCRRFGGRQAACDLGERSRASVLLVGKTSDFAAPGGTIPFAFEDSRIRFIINTDTADRSRLKFDSKLLALATIVHDERSKGG
jgi:hypothetical protein